MRNPTIAYVYPYFDMVYNSFFLEGLINIYGYKNIFFTKNVLPFNDNVKYQEWSPFCFIVNGKKYAIDVRDPSDVYDIFYEWCDTYAKVNFTDTSHGNTKIVPCAPYFPIRLKKPINIFAKCFFSARDPKSIKYYLLNMLYRPLKYTNLITEYQKPVKTNPKYIYYSSTLWKNSHNTNIYRARFMEACKKRKDLVFEGGFRDRPGFEDFSHLMKPHEKRSIPPKEYLYKSKISACAFTCPSVNNNYTWRTGEYIAMGKAILAVPGQYMPTNLEHGVNVHYTDGSAESINDALNIIITNHEYRTALENNTREFYCTHGNPKSVMTSIINSTK